MTAPTDDLNNRRRGQAPAANPAAVLVGALAGVALIAVACIAIRDAALRAGWIDGSEWLQSVTGWADRLTWQGWMWPASIALIVVGLLLIWTAVRPRRKEYQPIAAAPRLWTRRGDIARRCSIVAEREAGSATAITVVRKRKVTVKLDAQGPVDTVAVHDAVAQALAEIDAHQRVSVRVARRFRQRAESRAEVTS